MNARSLANNDKRSKFFRWLRTEGKIYHIIALQEVCHPARDMDVSRIQQWTREWGTSATACFAKHTGLLINNPDLTMTASSPDPHGRIIVADVRYKGDQTPDNFVRVVNVYAPANSQATPSPREFARDFPVDLINEAQHKIVLGDFNSAKDPLVDRFPPLTTLRHSWWHLFEGIIDRLGLQDLAPEPTRDENGVIEHTHFTRVSTSSASRARLDYIFASPSLIPAGMDTKYGVYSDPLSRSDHRWVTAYLNSTKLPVTARRTQKQKAKAAPSLDRRLLKDDDFRSKVRETLTNMSAERIRMPNKYPNAGVFWDACKAKILLAGQQYKNQKRIKNRKERVRLQKVLKDADCRMDSFPEDFAAIEDRTKALEDLRVFEIERMDHVATLAQVKWLEEGERASPFFTDRLKTASIRKSISSLKDVRGNITSDPKRMERIATDFYGALYTSQATDLTAQNTLLDTIPATIGIDDRNRLDQDISLEEIERSIDSMENRSAPGSDGIPYEFYKTFRDDVAPILVEICNDIGNSRAPPPASHRQALTTLIFKKGERDEMKNYRPISLTQTDYKIFTKVLTNRINPVARSVIDPWQTGFIPGRQGIDNALLLDLLSDHVIDGTHGEAAILSLDQEKAYDRVEWDYLHKVLERFGFGPKVRRWVQGCYSDLSAKILLDGRQSAPYAIRRGLRQGDPLAPILFNFVLEPFLRYYSSVASGVATADVAFKVAAFADDTTLGMRPGDEVHVLAAIDLHERASGAKVNREKTRVIPLTERARAVINLPGFDALDFKSAFEHLGVVIQPGGRQMKPIEKSVISALEKTVASWSKRRLTLQGRVTVLNTYLLSKLWYCAPFYDFSNDFYRSLDNLTRKVLWNSVKSRVKLEWLRRPKRLGGWNLINPRSQVAALKAKWLARWSTERPRWKFLFTDKAQEVFNQPTRERTRSFLAEPPTLIPKPQGRGRNQTMPLIRSKDSDPTRPVVISATVAFALLDVETKTLPNGHPRKDVYPGRIKTFAGSIPVGDFTVKDARRYLDTMQGRKVGMDTTLDFGKMNLKNRDPIDYTIQTPIHPDLWGRFFQRLHCDQRWPSEKEAIYLYAHGGLNTNARKMLFHYADATSGECRRCVQDPLCRPAPCETRGHAMYQCPSVQPVWESAIAWLQGVLPRWRLSKDLNEVALTWPSIPDLPPIAIYLHSAVFGAVYRTYCKIGDGEKLYRHQTPITSIVLFKQRAKVILARALYRDQRRREAATTPALRAELNEEPHPHYDAMYEEWNYPPHILVTREGVTFGPMWHHLGDEAVDNQEMEEEPQTGDDS